MYVSPWVDMIALGPFDPTNRQDGGGGASRPARLIAGDRRRMHGHLSKAKQDSGGEAQPAASTTGRSFAEAPKRPSSRAKFAGKDTARVPHACFQHTGAAYGADQGRSLSEPPSTTALCSIHPSRLPQPTSPGSPRGIRPLRSQGPPCLSTAGAPCRHPDCLPFAAPPGVPPGMPWMAAHSPDVPPPPPPPPPEAHQEAYIDPVPAVSPMHLVPAALPVSCCPISLHASHAQLTPAKVAVSEAEESQPLVFLLSSAQNVFAFAAVGCSHTQGVPAEMCTDLSRCESKEPSIAAPDKTSAF